MTVLFIADDSLFPTNSGGRVEALGELHGLIELGIPVRLLVSHRLDISDKDKELHRAIDPEAVFLKRSSFLTSTICRPWSPYQLASRRMTLAQTRELIGGSTIRAVIASHEWTIDLAHRAAKVCKAPVILRSHNDEVAYMNSLAQDAYAIQRLYYRAEAVRLRWALASLMEKVCLAAVLSDADSHPYESLGVRTQLIPPVLTESSEEQRTADRRPPESSEILFVGSLDAPQAVQGLKWFITDVLPLIRESFPSAVLVIAGRRASPGLVQELKSNPHVRYMGEVRDLEPTVSSVRIFINPVFSGSGVNMKVGPPSQHGVPIVSTSIGARGLDAIASGLSVADSPIEFSKLCVDLLTSDDLWASKSKLLQRNIRSFTPLAAGTALATLVHDLSGEKTA
ncbi:glycosyltransferase [Arthrobacter sp. NPDC093125]|uniref:glycosyltransferase n=1 Tax=Arthrobacter sp. NPDC093125 TaxID=3363944 RepID=UPI0038254E43